MREIKFRGRRIDNGEWVEGAYVHNGNRPFIVSHDVVDYDEEYIAPSFWWRVDPETVGQYTGLKDKNGTEIYEGDIIKIYISSDGMGMYWTPPKSNGIAVVKWDMCAWMWETKFIVDGKEDKRYITFPSAWCHWTCEIIGNIHDNPELLGGAE